MTAREMTDHIHHIAIWRRLDGLGIMHCALVRHATV